MGRFNRRDSGSSDRRFSRGNFRGQDRDREMHKTICSECGKNCEVPFAPTSSKPVYCNDCFRNKGGRGESGGFRDRNGRSNNFERRDASQPQIVTQLVEVNKKLDKLLLLLSETPNKRISEPQKNFSEILIYPKKEKIKKKKTSETV